MNIEGVLGDISPREYTRRDNILKRLRKGIVYTKFANNIYSQEYTELGDRIPISEDRLVRKMIRDGILKVENQRIKINE